MGNDFYRFLLKNAVNVKICNWLKRYIIIDNCQEISAQ